MNSPPNSPNPHVGNEELSAFIDSELDATERTMVEDHLKHCGTCRSDLESLRKANSALASLPPPKLSADASRALRQSVRDKASPGRLRFRWGAAAGVVGLAAAVIIGILVIPNLRGDPGLVGTAPETLLASSYDDDKELAEAVEQDPTVKEALGRYTVGDVGVAQDEEVSRLTGEEDSAASEEAPESSEGSLFGESEATTQEGCLRLVLSKLPYAMIPILTKPITYKGTESWLYVFAWTNQQRDDAPLDRIQIWVMDRTGCNQLYYLSFRP